MKYPHTRLNGKALNTIENLEIFLKILGWGVRFDKNKELELFFLESNLPIYRSNIFSNHFDFQMTELISACHKNQHRWITRLKCHLTSIAFKSIK